MKYFKEKSIGILMSKEFKYLTQNNKDKSTVLIGGAKISSKIKMIKNYLDKCDNILVGGAMAFTLMPDLASSKAILFVSCTSPALAAA